MVWHGSILTRLEKKLRKHLGKAWKKLADTVNNPQLLANQTKVCKSKSLAIQTSQFEHRSGLTSKTRRKPTFRVNVPSGMRQGEEEEMEGNEGNIDSFVSTPNSQLAKLVQLLYLETRHKQEATKPWKEPKAEQRIKNCPIVNGPLVKDGPNEPH